MRKTTKKTECWLRLFHTYIIPKKSPDKNEYRYNHSYHENGISDS